jgi:TfoX/Sxy family transcriptional regulator of competence genes
VVVAYICSDNLTLAQESLMAYDELLAQRIRNQFAPISHVEEKKMMGGLTFMVKGKMCVGVIKDEMMCRIDPELHAAAVEMPGCRTMDFTKRPMKGYVMIEDTGMKSQKAFTYWIDLALAFNEKAKVSKKRS